LWGKPGDRGIQNPVARRRRHAIRGVHQEAPKRCLATHSWRAGRSERGHRQRGHEKARCRISQKSGKPKRRDKEKEFDERREEEKWAAY